MPSVGDRRRAARPAPTVGLLLLAVVVVVMASSCGSSDDEPELVPTSTEVSTTAPVVATEQVALTMADAVPADAPPLVLSTDSGISRWTVSDGPVVVLELDEGIRHAVDDGSGGVVALTVDDQLLGSIGWWPADEAPLVLRSQGGLALHDGARRNGEPAVVITYSPIDVAEPSQVLDVLDLATTSARTVRAVGDAESGAASVAASDQGFAIAQVDQDCTRLLLFDDAGEPIGGWTVPPPVCAASSDPAYTAVAWADDGSQLAVARRGPTAAILLAGIAGAPVQELTFDEPLSDITNIDTDGRFVVATTGETTILIDPRARSWVDLGVRAHSVSVAAAP